LSPEEWSSLVYGNTENDGLIQTIMDELLTSASFAETINEFFTGTTSAENSHLSYLRAEFELLSSTNTTNMVHRENPRWLLSILRKVPNILKTLIELPPRV